MKIGRNADCPCGNLAKFKHCCAGHVDWERILGSGSGYERVINLNARGKNRLFGHRVAEILGLSKLPHEVAWLDVKRAMTPSAVRELHETVALLWPTEQDLRRVLKMERGRQNALYVGMYQPEPILRGIARHALYSDTVLVLDPFMHPAAVRDEFSPVLHPEQHRANTLIALRLWFLIGPWIEAGLVKVIRSPGDFDAELARATLDVTAARYESTPELMEIADRDVAEHREEMEDYGDFAKLSYPDHEIARRVREHNPDVSDQDVAALLGEVQEMRDAHPFYVEPAKGPGRDRQLLTITSGAAYEMAKIVASLTPRIS